MGIKTRCCAMNSGCSSDSEKPPHHMGIKTFNSERMSLAASSLKNLPTTWGLRPDSANFRLKRMVL